HGHFREVLDSGLRRDGGSTSMALADANGDGSLDLYVANYRASTVRDAPPDPPFRVSRVNGQLTGYPRDRFAAVRRRDGEWTLLEKGEADVLYLNDGHGHFRAQSWTNGMFLDAAGRPLSQPPQGWGLSAMFRDLNGDLAPDLYVCNDFGYSADDIWIN